MNRVARVFSAGAVSLISLLIAGGMIMLGLFGCGTKKYNVDYCGMKDCFEGAKDSYKAGEEVVVYYGLIATDTDYSFYLDGERINTGYSEGHGFEIKFTMPEHDVELRCESVNSMVYVPPIEPGTLLVDYYKATVATVGGDGYREITLTYYDPVQVQLDVYENYGEDAVEEVTSYLVPYEAAERCINVIYEENLDSWAGRDDLSGITGARYVLNIRREDGEYVRVTSDEMPPDGQRAFDKVYSILCEYLMEEYLIQ